MWALALPSNWITTFTVSITYFSLKDLLLLWDSTTEANGAPCSPKAVSGLLPAAFQQFLWPRKPLASSLDPVGGSEWPAPSVEGTALLEPSSLCLALSECTSGGVSWSSLRPSPFLFETDPHQSQSH